MRLVLALLLAIVAALPLRGAASTGEEIVAELSSTRVEITTSFAGSEIFIFGAVKRESPIPEGRLGVVVTVIGPSQPVIVRKKERRFGIWINGPGVQIDSAPSFFAVATNGTYFDTISHTDNMRYRVGLDQVIRLIDAPDWVEAERTDYRDAVVRLRRDAGNYFLNPGGVRVSSDTLFQTRIRLPANLVEGNYRARIFITRDREVIDTFEASIAVRKEGLERWITVLAKENGLLYGAISILIALGAGWLASSAFRFAVQ